MISPTKFYLKTDKKPDYDKNYIPIGNVIAGLNIVNTIAKGDFIRRIQITRIRQKATAFGRQQFTVFNTENYGKKRGIVW
jgi:cyclophilin family peptidyl-prolyl cis-trans isomerase